MFNKEMISHEALEKVAAFRRNFSDAKPFRYVVIDNFFKPDIAEALVREFPACADPSKLLNEFGAPNPKNAISDVRSIGGVYKELDGYIQTRPFLEFMEQVTGISDLRYDPWYYGAGTHENFHTAGLDAHYDFNVHPKTQQHRRLNAIVYLNKLWNPEWGGSICFHNDPWNLESDEIVEVSPDFNRCVVFETTERSWHSVRTVKVPPEMRSLSRKSFTIYLYTESRPDSEIAPSHGTVYVQGPLPKHLQAGHTLSADDLEEIKSNIARRHTYLREMYRREYQLSQEIMNLQSTLAEARRRIHIPISGYAKLLDVTQAPHADGWMSERIEFRLQPLRPTQGVVLHAYRPESYPPISVTLKTNMGSTSIFATGLFCVEAKFPHPTEEKIEVIVEATAARGPSTIDQRKLSVVVDRLEMIEPPGNISLSQP